MINRVVLMGRLTRDPELRYTQSNLPVTSFSLACDRRFSRGEDKITDFFDIVCWRQDAEFAAKWFSKGQLVAVTGRLQQRQWQDKEGNKRTSFEIVADELSFAEGKRADSPGPREIGGGPGSGGTPAYGGIPPASQDGRTRGQPSGGYTPLPSVGAGGFKDFSEDDEDELPF